MLAVDLTYDKRLVPGRPKPFINDLRTMHGPYGVSADGRSLLMIAPPTQTSSGHLVMVLNLGVELARRVVPRSGR